MAYAHVHPKRVLAALTLLARSLTISLALLSAHFPLFDASPLLLPSSSVLPSVLLRWDSFHYAHIARAGYTYEHLWAFLPGTPIAMIIGASVLRFLSFPFADYPTVALRVPWTTEELLRGGALLATVCDAAATTALYDLSLYHLRSPKLAWLSALMSLLAQSPSALRLAPYSEPFFTFLSFKGMLCCANKRWVKAGIYFALASAFRSNGITLCGFILWGLLVVPFLGGKRINVRNAALAVSLTALTLAPFITHNVVAFLSFCLPPAATDHIGGLGLPASRASWTPALWCANMPPSVYQHVQKRYWDGGLFSYWKPAQVPNFLLAAPVLVLLVSWAVSHIQSNFSSLRPRAANVTKSFHEQSSLNSPGSSIILMDATRSPFDTPSLTPHAIHALVLAGTLLFAANVQIALRVLHALPATHWTGAWLLARDASTAQSSLNSTSTQRGDSCDDGADEEKMDEDSVKRDHRERHQMLKQWDARRLLGEHWRWGSIWVAWCVLWGTASIVLWSTGLPPA